MTIQFYGAPASSSGRTHLMLEECAVPYEYHRVHTRDPAAKAEFAKVNPGGMVPFLIDGEVRLRESVACNFYLAEKYAPQLWASSVEERAQLYAWSLWAITNLQPAAMEVMYHAFIFPVEKRRPEAVEHGKLTTQRLIDELEAALPGDYLVGGRYTVADVNVASVVYLAERSGACKLGPRVARWLAACQARPAWQRAATAG